MGKIICYCRFKEKSEVGVKAVSDKTLNIDKCVGVFFWYTRVLNLLEQQAGSQKM